MTTTVSSAARSVCKCSSESSQQRAERLLTREISFVSSPVFEEWKQQAPKAIDDYDRKRLESTTWLTADEERLWFRWMNYKKFRANQWRGRLSSNPGTEAMDRLECLIADAEEIRNRLVTVYVKLAASLAGRFVNSRFAIDELLSEANATLMRCVEMFDADRGFRFSTYATHSVRRHLCRYVKQASKRPALSPPELLQSHPESERHSLQHQQRLLKAAKTLECMLGDLRHREELIIRARFGLGESPQTRTLQAIADELGVSRERVRQIERRALGKLAKRASALKLEQAD